MAAVTCKRVVAVGARAFVAWIEERCFAEENADQSTLNDAQPTWLGRLKRIDILNESVVTEISTLVSESLTPQRAVLKRVQGQFSVGGDINVELSNDGFVWLITQAIGKILISDSTAVILPAGSDGIASDSTAVAIQNTVSSDYVSDGPIQYTDSDGVDSDAFEVGHYDVDAFSLEPGATFIIGRDAGVIKDSDGVDPTNTGLYFKYTGMRVNTWAVTAAPDAIVTSTFGMLGKKEEVKDWNEPSPVFETTNDPFTGFNGTVTIFKDEVNSANDTDLVDQITGACVLSFDMTLSNDMATDQFCLGQKERNSIPEQNRSIEGTLTAEFTDLILYQKFIDGTPAALKVDFDLNDDDKETLTILLPSIEFNGSTPVNAGAEVINQELPFTALWEDNGAFILTNTAYHPGGGSELTEGFDIAVEVASANAGTSAFATNVN